MRIFQPIPLCIGTTICLNEAAHHHVVRVLRAKRNDVITLFNGQGGEYRGIITQIDKKHVWVELQESILRITESPLTLCLAQGISRGEKMDYTIQKAVELGVTHIVPLFTERCNVKLDEERREKRLQHWQSIVIGACEQSGRNAIPEIIMPQTLERWLSVAQESTCFVLSPDATTRLSQQSLQGTTRATLLIGPEGGLSDQEIHLASQKGFIPLRLGPRILRTETAAVAAIAVLQGYFGDV